MSAVDRKMRWLDRVLGRGHVEPEAGPDPDREAFREEAARTVRNAETIREMLARHDKAEEGSAP